MHLKVPPKVSHTMGKLQKHKSWKQVRIFCYNTSSHCTGGQNQCTMGGKESKVYEFKRFNITNCN